MSNLPKAEREEVEVFLRGGLELESSVYYASTDIREQSKAAYKQSLLDARLALVSVLNHLQQFKLGVPGKTDAQISERLVLVTIFCQGITVTEQLISEGQYIKATAVLKQDYEIMTRILEVKGGHAVPSRTPNVRHAPEGSRRFYGELNSIAHPSNIHLLPELMHQVHEDGVHGISHVPVFNEAVACNLYELHVCLLFQVVREAIALANEMYGGDDEGIHRAMKHTIIATEFLKEAGFQFIDAEEPQKSSFAWRNFIVVRLSSNGT